jgi:mycothiol synthase
VTTTPPPAPRVEVVRHLAPDEVREVAVLLENVTEADGVRPLSEHAGLHLRHGGGDDVRHVLVRLPGADVLVGFAHLDLSDPVAGAVAELAVHPDHRHRGIGRLLVEHLLEESPGGRLRLWAHGDAAAAAGLATSLGFVRSRTLRRMVRSLRGALPEARLPEGVTVRTFVPGQDDAAWLSVNAAAFAGHPEQGGWTLADLRHRIAEPWFDPAGFFLAERDGELVGFHWTKVHGGSDHDGGHEHGHDRIGEVYVVGVRPDQHGSGLGTALTLLGLAHLKDAGLPAVMLYVDADNAAATAVYTRLGFTTRDTDVMYATPTA